ncbi:peptidase S16 lon domain protein [Thermocrinis albus DSM 14484]|uniref:endopeptidase La n=1 Tax=Thermocrinis albus (strain DSM 14484 / JCM 11386 / HI 11/12) TaxID=638303 RepID=D3SLS5_THEAH|nr:ATP-binding protein [Thermocrinis albus]ADC89705.1 peptidase S16 lon domain protein [Thermocrinis albus DSM 14484]
MRELRAEDLILDVKFNTSTAEVESAEIFIGQDRVKRAFQVALSTWNEGYNIYVSGPESIGRTTYTLQRLMEAAKDQPVPEDICYVHNFDDPLKPLCLLLPAGMGKKLAEEIDRALETLKVELPRAFESKEYEEELAHIGKQVEEKRQKLLDKMAEEARHYGLGVVLTPAGIKLLPLMGKRLIPEEEIYADNRLMEAYEKNLSAFEEKFRDYMRELRELDHFYMEKVFQLKEKVARYVVEKALGRCEERYCHIPQVETFLARLKEELVRNVDLFLSWKSAEANPEWRKALERNFRRFRINVLVDNSHLKGAPVILEEVPSFPALFGKVSYSMEMGVLYADHMSLSPGSLHKARGGYLVVRVLDLLKNPFLWDAFKKVIMHGKIHMQGYPLEDMLVPYVGITPEPTPATLKVALIGDPLTYHLLSLYDPEFGRLFKVKAEFDPVVDLSEEKLRLFPQVIRKVVEKEGLKHVSADGLEELARYAIKLAGNRKKMSVVMGPLVDLLREAQIFSGDSPFIRGEHVKRAYREKVYRSNLLEEKIQKAIKEGKLFIDIEGSKVGQVNGLSVYDLGDISFGKPTRITASVYMGEKGIINIEREVELSGPIHSKGVLILSGYIGNTYGRDIPLHLTCNITFEQSYEEVEGDSASVAELVAILSAIAEVPVRQDIAITGSVDQRGNVQPVGGIKEKVEGFYKVCKLMGLTGTQGVVLPEANVDDLVLEDELIEAVDKGLFHIYAVRHVDEVIELLTHMKAEQFHRLVRRKLVDLLKKSLKPKKNGGMKDG